MRISPDLKNKLIAIGVEIVMGQLSDSETIAKTLEEVARDIRTRVNAASS